MRATLALGVGAVERWGLPAVRRSRPAVGRSVVGLLIALAAVGVTVPVAARTPAGPADTSPFRLNLMVDDCEIFATDVPQSPTPDPQVTITLKHGKVTKLKRTVASQGGEVDVDICPVLVRGGDVLKLAANGVARTVTIPVLSGHIDPFTRQVSGRGPVDGELFATVYNCDLYLGSGCRGIVSGVQQTVSPAGTWSIDLGSRTDWDPGFSDFVSVLWRLALGGDEFLVEQVQDAATIRVGSAVVSGHARPGSKVTLSLVARGGAVRAAATAVASGVGGSWKATLRSRTGAKVKVRAGDTLRTNLLKTRTRPGASIKALPVRPTVLTDPGLPSANGDVTCWPNGRVGILMYPPDNRPGLTFAGGSPSDGRFEFSNTVDVIQLGWTVESHCLSPQFMDQVAFDQTVAP